MIKINLCPIDELESQYWYVPDVTFAAVIAALAFLGVQYFLGTIQERIDTTNANITSLTESYDKLAPDLAKFSGLKADVAALNTSLDALKAITVSKISKYKPVIVIEHFQNLKPEGVWFQSIKIGVESPNSFEVKGQAFDNILTAEFITALRSTESGESDESDLRTQVFFNGLVLDSANPPLGAGEFFPELTLFPEFNIKGKFQERGAAPEPATPSKPPLPTVSRFRPETAEEVKF